MATVAQHYESHLAPVYPWMAGGIEHALATGTGDIADLARAGGVAVDLGAGFGMHAIPLARAGYRVLAIDSSTMLLRQLSHHAQPRLDESRFIPVRSDASRILTCFIEDRGAHVLVHDILHERVDGTWTMSVSSYRKLELSADDVAAGLRGAGLDATVAPGPRGMLRAVATR